MLKILLNLACFCILGSLHRSAIRTEDCWRLNDTYLYSLMREYGAADFDTAVLICSNRNSTLASIHSAEENEFLDTLRHQNVAVPVWIGMRRKEYTREWVDGTSLDYIAPYEALAYRNACIYLFQTWYEAECESNLYFICKKEAIADNGEQDEICKEQEESSTLSTSSDQSSAIEDSSSFSSLFTSNKLSVTSLSIMTEIDRTSKTTMSPSHETSRTRDLREPDFSSSFLIFPSSSMSIFTPLDDSSVLLLTSAYRDPTESRGTWSTVHDPSSSTVQSSYSFSVKGTYSMDSFHTSEGRETSFQSIYPITTIVSASKSSNSIEASRDISLHRFHTHSQTALTMSRDAQSRMSSDAQNSEAKASSLLPRFNEEEFNRVLDDLRVKKKTKVVAKEAPGGEAFGAVAMIILFAIFAGVVLLDLGTIHNHIKLFVRNVKGVCQRGDDSTVDREITSSRNDLN